MQQMCRSRDVQIIEKHEIIDLGCRGSVNWRPWDFRGSLLDALGASSGVPGAPMGHFGVPLEDEMTSQGPTGVTGAVKLVSI